MSRKYPVLGSSILQIPYSITGDIDPIPLLTGLPGYLVNLTAEPILEGAVIESAVGTMDGELHEILAF